MSDEWKKTEKEEKQRKGLVEAYSGLTGKLRQDSFREKARTFLVYLTAIALPLLYLGIFGGLTLDAIFSIKTGGLSFVSLVSSRLVFIEISKRARYDEWQENEELKTQEEENKRLRKKGNDHFDIARDFSEEDNAKRQEKKNTIAKQNALQAITEKINKRKLKGKGYKRLEAKKQLINDNGVFDKNFKPINIAKLIYQKENAKSGNVLDERDFYYNEITDGFFSSTVFAFLRFFGLGVVGSAPLMIDEPFKNVLVYYVGLFVLLFITTITRYDTVRKKTAKEKLQTLENQNTYLRDMETYIEEAPHERTEEKHEDTDLRANPDNSGRDEEDGRKAYQKDRGGEE